MSARRFAGYASALFLAAATAVTTFRSPASGSTAATLSVRAADGWQDAAVDLTAGEALEVRYITGTWTINVAGRWFDADGYPGYYPRDIQGACAMAPLPDEQNGALIGRIGGGPPFLIGNHKAIVTDRAGALQMRMNDADACYPDNGGSVEVAVSHGAAATAPATAEPSPAYPAPPTVSIPAYPAPSTETAMPALPATASPRDGRPSASDATAPGAQATPAPPPPARLPGTGGPDGSSGLIQLAAALMAIGLGARRWPRRRRVLGAG